MCPIRERCVVPVSWPCPLSPADYHRRETETIEPARFRTIFSRIFRFRKYVGTLMGVFPAHTFFCSTAIRQHLRCKSIGQTIFFVSCRNMPHSNVFLSVGSITCMRRAPMPVLELAFTLSDVRGEAGIVWFY